MMYILIGCLELKYGCKSRGRFSGSSKLWVETELRLVIIRVYIFLSPVMTCKNSKLEPKTFNVN